MKFLSGMSWKACYDPGTGRYTAETWGQGNSDLYEITGAIYAALGAKDIPDSEAERLISEGRHLYMHVNDRFGPPYTVVFDDDYKTLCPWFGVSEVGKVWPDALTDAAVELFASEEKNREQRRAKRKKREGS